MQLKNLPILYTYRRCPYAMRARMAIYVAGIKVEPIEVSLKDKPQRLLDYSPKATVPVLVTVEGNVIEQSRDIMLWALQQHDPDDWLLQGDSIKQRHMIELVDRCDIEFKPLLDRYKYFDRHPEQPQDSHRERAEFFLQFLESKLATQNFIIDEKIRFADVAIFPFVRQFVNVDKDWFAHSPYPNLQRWLNTCINTNMFESIMKKV